MLYTISSKIIIKRYKEQEREREGKRKKRKEKENEKEKEKVKHCNNIFLHITPFSLFLFVLFLIVLEIL